MSVNELLDGEGHRESWQQRRSRALAALQQAETATGVRSRAGMVGSGRSGVTTASPARHADASAAGGGDDRRLPVPAVFAPVIGGIARGDVTSICDSQSLLVAFVAAAARPATGPLWVAMIGAPEVGMAAAAEAGMDLGRSVLIPDPGPGAASVAAAAVDGFDVVVIGTNAHLSEATRRSLLHRVRHRQIVLLATQSWPGSALTVRTTGRQWQGVGRGEGLLQQQHLDVHLTGCGLDHAMRVSLAAGGRTDRLGGSQHSQHSRWAAAGDRPELHGGAHASTAQVQMSETVPVSRVS